MPGALSTTGFPITQLDHSPQSPNQGLKLRTRDARSVYDVLLRTDPKTITRPTARAKNPRELTDRGGLSLVSLARQTIQCRQTARTWRNLYVPIYRQTLRCQAGKLAFAQLESDTMPGPLKHR